MAMRSSDNRPVLRKDETCWRIDNASRLSLLIDTESYFRALTAALRAARRTVYIVGWEIDAETKLVIDAEPSFTFTELLSEILDEREALHIYVLRWDYAPSRVGENLLSAVSGAGWPRSDRFHLHADGSHAPGASHHQKLVVIDDEVAFAGGMDITSRRWDTPEHLANDPRRVDRRGNAYGPWHDVQLAVEGPVAASLGALARERWRRAAGEIMESPDGGDDGAPSPWPDELASDLKNSPIGISRTLAAFDDYPSAEEVRALYLDAIGSARRFIYVENQYFTSHRIGDALAERLKEANGPEVVIVAPSQNEGWLEEGLMSTLRVRLLNRLQKSNRFNRLRTYYPVVPNLEDGHVDLHSKILIVDDELFSVGSANVSNRSMALDTELVLTIEASRGATARRRAIRRFRSQLVGEHLGVEPSEVEASLAETGSLIQTIDSLARNERTLSPLSNEYPAWIESVAPSSSVTDPERPVDSTTFIEAMIPRRAADLTNHPLLKAVVGGLALAGLAAWRIWPRLAVRK